MNIENKTHYLVIEHLSCLPFRHPCRTKVIILTLRIVVLTVTVLRLGLATIVVRCIEVTQ
jgi:hypothetical protein